MESVPVDHFLKAQQFVPTTHRDVYTAIEPQQSSLSQKGKVVIVTGASQGLGARVSTSRLFFVISSIMLNLRYIQAFVPSFASAGARAIVLVARSVDKLKVVASSVAEAFPEVETLSVPTDITDTASVAALFAVVKEKYGHADVLINNAGVFKAISPVKDVDQQMWWEEMVSQTHKSHFALLI
jgi:NADP-dependent 3-hydroxy acid dehydrogenase YdfG